MGLVNKPKTKAGWVATLLFIAATSGFVVFMLVVTGREPSVIIENNTLTISGMYGTSVNMEDITSVTLIEQNMKDIGAGSRRNGANGSTWRGHFDAGLLFVKPNASPTLRIERAYASTIFISFTDGQETRTLYHDLLVATR
jgi:hypothetical protein